MPQFAPAADDLHFILHDLLHLDREEGPAPLDRDLSRAVLDEAARLAAEVMAPLNPVGDSQGCRLENGIVRTPEGFGPAYRALAGGGWIGLDAPEDWGGQNLPFALNTAVTELFAAANVGLYIYAGLTHGAISALLSHGSEAQKALYLPPMIEGRWTGTMNLTEPQCGTDLGLIRTRATPQADGSHAITGQKIWISGGDQDLTENIVHLVLARLPDAPEGTRGISLFLVPKVMVNPDGSLGARNAVQCIGLESKMGLHGSSTCVMQYEGATGWLVGAPHRGMAAMFTMMNEARVGVGVQGYALAAAAHRLAVDFARDRLQGRAVGGPANPGGPADPILVHPEVRRALMEQRALIEGGRALALWGASLSDRVHRQGDARAGALLSLLTPVIKGFLTDRGFDMAVSAQQVFGGAGYTRAAGVEQIVRDARIARIYEGTNGVQALDLVGRKLGAEGGAVFMGFLAEIRTDCARIATDHPDLAEALCAPLERATQDMQDGALYFMQEGMKNPAAALAGSLDFLHLTGHVCLGLMWLRMAAAVAGRTDPFAEAKRATARYYMARELPATALHLTRIRSGAAPVMALDPAAF